MRIHAGGENTPGKITTIAAVSDGSTQTPQWQSVVSCHSQTSPPSLVAKGVQVQLFKEERPAQTGDASKEGLSNIRQDIAVSTTEIVSQRQHDNTSKSTRNAQVSSGEIDEFSNVLEVHRIASARASICTSDQQVQTSCIVINVGTSTSPLRSEKPAHVRETIQTDQGVQATSDNLDVATSTVPCTLQEQQPKAGCDVGTFMSPTRLSQQACAVCSEAGQESNLLLVFDSSSPDDESQPATTGEFMEATPPASTDGACEEEEKQKEACSEDERVVEASSDERAVESSNIGQTIETPSLLDCIPAIEVDEDRDDPVSPPHGTLVPRKKEKRVSFVDQEVAEPTNESGTESEER